MENLSLESDFTNYMAVFTSLGGKQLEISS